MMRLSYWQIRLILSVVSILTALLIIVVVLRSSRTPALESIETDKQVAISAPWAATALLVLLIGGLIAWRLKVAWDDTTSPK